MLWVVAFSFTGCKTSSKIITSKEEAARKGVYAPPKAMNIPEYVLNKPSKRTGDCSAIDNTERIVSQDRVTSYPKSILSILPIQTAVDYLGVRYRSGGTSAAGMDCSGLVYTSFKAHNIKLPRTSHEMSQTGVTIPKQYAKPGDLIFFHTGRGHRINHVGIVTEVFDDEVRFIHSSIQRGVIISSTKEPYYARAYAQINRILE